MIYSTGDILLIKFPFTNLSEFKKRPVLVVKADKIRGDFICFQITSKSTSSNLLKIEKNDLKSGDLKLISFLKYDKCFTLNNQIVDKKLADVNLEFMNKLKELFCNEAF